MTSLITKLSNLSRRNKQLIMFIVDAIVIILALFMSFSIRLGYWYYPESNLTFVIFGAPIISNMIFIYFGMYNTIVRYVGFRALWDIVKAVSLYALIWGLIGLMAAVDGIPRSVILINWVISLLAIGGLRVAAVWIFTKDKSAQNQIYSKIKSKNVIVYGAGDAGIQLVSALKFSFEYNPVGFVDDSIELQGNFIGGLNVYSLDDIKNQISKLNVIEVLIAIPSASRNRKINIASSLESYPVTVRMLPGVSELAEGRVNISDLRVISINDLLGRKKIDSKKNIYEKNITDRVVLVTGAGGSIGSELCRQIIIKKPKALILYEISEFALYEIDKELCNLCEGLVKIHPVLGSVTNRARLENIFEHFDVDTVYHAAAYKHVPMVEFNITEGVLNNIFGTLNCAQVSIQNNVDTFVLISTDKAVRPTNTMGATKRCAELILQALSVNQNKTKFTMVRFGNVLDSSGSVIPLFKKQIKEGGPVTVTHKNIMRYFMLIPEAVELVIQAGAMGSGGDVFVLDMGKPIKIKDLAEKMIRLSGLKVRDKSNLDGDIEIKYIGLRPGEKLYEELLIGDNVGKTKNPLIMRAKEEMYGWEKLSPILKDLNNAALDFDQEKIRSLLINLVPGFKPENKIKDVLYKKTK